jgi:outer membrane protein OmpA-like peptidoglycan-associated protein
MSRWLRLAVAVVPLALGACSARLTSSLVPPAAPASYVGARAGVIDAAALEQELQQLEQALDALTGRSAAVPAQLSRQGGALLLRFGATESFGGSGAQLRPAALAAYAELARILSGRPGTVAHIVVRGDAGLPSSQPALGLPARRAASLQAYLATRGVPGTRLRAEGRADAETEAIEVLLKPIVAGREPEAWIPPS